MKRILMTFGTRPEAIKMAPVLRALSEAGFNIQVRILRQHKEMLDQVLRIFNIEPKHEYAVSFSDKAIFSSGASISNKIKSLFNSILELFRFWKFLRQDRPDLLLVQGDTNTAVLATLAGYFAGVKVGHIEAGLRTYKLLSPFPEEINRRIISRFVSINFAPTERAKNNLLEEGRQAKTIVVTGNTEIDALKHILDRQAADENYRPVQELWNKYGLHLDPQKKLVLVTAHRRENFGEGIKNICTALARLAERPDVQIVYPVHPNPHVDLPVRAALANQANIVLTRPMDYDDFAYLMAHAYIILTDSGGIQEATSYLGKPTLIMREVTERPEAIEGGNAKLVGTDPDLIFKETSRLLDDENYHKHMAIKHEKFGDGHAAEKIVEAIQNYFGEK